MGGMAEVEISVPREEPMLSVRGLVFDYPAHRAIDNVSFGIPRGSITGLVGPNGAGKSTLLKVCAALERPFAGSVLLDGMDVHAEPRAAHRRMGFLPDFYGHYDELTVAQCLEYRAAAQGVPASRRPAAIARVVERLGIADRLRQSAGSLSRGLRQRLAIAQAVIHAPDFLMLDEPAAGLDPDARIGLSAVLRVLRDEGMTIIVSSHILSELQDYSTHVLMLKDGRLIAYSELDVLEPVFGAGSLLRLELAAADSALASRLSVIPGLEVVNSDASGALIRGPGGAALRAELLKRLVDAGLPVSAFGVERQSLQDVYLARMHEGEALESGGKGAGGDVVEP
jgi:ABC-2 type transport system ATP-binding protein